MRFVASLLAALAMTLAASPAEAKWVGSWTASPHAPLGTTGPFAAGSYENVTISQILRLTEGGTRLRVKFSNRYGPAPLEIGAARIVAIDANNQEVAGTSRMLTFGGDAGAVIPRGAPFVSDPVDGSERAFNDLQRRADDLSALTCAPPAGARTSRAAARPTVSISKGINRVH